VESRRRVRALDGRDVHREEERSGEVGGGSGRGFEDDEEGYGVAMREGRREGVRSKVRREWCSREWGECGLQWRCECNLSYRSCCASTQLMNVLRRSVLPTQETCLRRCEFIASAILNCLIFKYPSHCFPRFPFLPALHKHRPFFLHPSRTTLIKIRQRTPSQITISSRSQSRVIRSTHPKSKEREGQATTSIMLPTTPMPEYKW
jgi:hypothetical protein